MLQRFLSTSTSFDFNGYDLTALRIAFLFVAAAVGIAHSLTSIPIAQWWRLQVEGEVIGSNCIEWRGELPHVEEPTPIVQGIERRRKKLGTLEKHRESSVLVDY
jgi:hypothetical protein